MLNNNERVANALQKLKNYSFNVKLAVPRKQASADDITAIIDVRNKIACQADDSMEGKKGFVKVYITPNGTLYIQSNDSSKQPESNSELTKKILQAKESCLQGVEEFLQNNPSRKSLLH